MKKYLIVTGIVALVLWGMNPGMDDFKTYMKTYTAERVEEATGGGALGRVLGGATSSIVSGSVGAVTERQTYLVLSTYTIDPDDDGAAEYRFLGIAGQFIVLRQPE